MVDRFHYDIYWIEKEERNLRNPSILCTQCYGVMAAGVHLITLDNDPLHFISRAIPYNQWNVSRENIDEMVAESASPKIIFENDIVIANVNFSTRLPIAPFHLDCFDRLMEGIQMAPLSRKIR